MKSFKIDNNKYLDNDIKAYYNCDYVGYQKKGNPDFINRLKNMSKSHSELDLVEDFIEVYERAIVDLQKIVKENNLRNISICVIPRSKSEKNYKENQMMFKKAISSAVDKLEYHNATNAIKRVKDTKTTHTWRMENNNGLSPYKGITKDTCEVKRKDVVDKNIILIDDIYTEGVYIVEDCIQYLLDLGAKSVILYIIAKTKE